MMPDFADYVAVPGIDTSLCLLQLIILSPSNRHLSKTKIHPRFKRSADRGELPGAELEPFGQECSLGFYRRQFEGGPKA